METFRINDPIIKHSIFNWNIVNSILCLTRTRYVTTSPVFSFADSTWFLELSVEHNNVEVFTSVSLCRRGDDGGPPGQIRAKFVLSLRTPTGMIFKGEEYENAFENGNAFGLIYLTTKENFCDVLGNENHEETLVVVCDMIAVVGCFSRPLSADKLYLSEDLLLMLKFGGTADARMHTRGKTFPVQKEILSARSPVFKEMFMSNVVEISVPFAEDVVEAMLKYIYSGLAEKITRNDLPPSTELYLCAVEYRISDLMKLLSPTMIYASTILKCSFEQNVSIAFPHFGRSFADRTAPERILLESVTLHKIVEGRIFSSLDRESGNVSFEAEFRHTVNTDQREASLYGRYSFFDRFGQLRFTTRNVSSFDGEGKLCVRFCVGAENLFGIKNIVFPSDVLTMECQLKLGLPYETCISDAECVDYNHPVFVEEHRMLNLVSSMVYLLDSKLFTNIELGSKLDEKFKMMVHKSILSARSPVFSKLLERENSLKLHLPGTAIKALVSYIYTGSFPNRNSQPYVLYKASDVYEIYGLKNKCVNVIRMCPLTPGNVLKKFNFADTRGYMLLRKICKMFILKNADLVLGTLRWERFRKLHANLAREILTSINQNA